MLPYANVIGISGMNESVLLQIFLIIFVSENLMKCITSYNVRYDGDHLSDHNAIQLCIGVQAQQTCV